MSKLNKQPIRDFIRQYYSEQTLADFLAHARDGRFSFFSCCCLVGIPTADHALRTFDGRTGVPLEPHYVFAKKLVGGVEAEGALIKWIVWILKAQYGFADQPNRANRAASRVLIPLVKTEMWRRAKLRKVSLAAGLSEPASPIQSVEKELAVATPRGGE